MRQVNKVFLYYEHNCFRYFRPENGGGAPIETVDNTVYEARTRTREDNRRNENLVPNPLYISVGTTLPQPQELTYRP